MSRENMELRRKRANLWNEAQEILNKYDSNEARWAGEDEQKFDRLMDEIDQLDKRIEREERLYSRKKEGALEEPARPAVEQRDQPSQEEYREAFSQYLRFGVDGLNQEQRSLLAQNFNQFDQSETRALSAVTGASGGYTVPEGFYNQLIDAMKWFGGMRQARTTVLTTSSGNNLPIPTADDTGNVGAIVNENTQVGEQDTTFGQKNLGAYMYTSKIIRVPYQLLQDSAFDIESWLRNKLAERIGRITNAHFTTGTGTSEPQGVVTGALEGKVGATGQIDSITYEDLVDLEHSVDPAYRMSAEFMFHDNTLRALKKLKDNDGRPLWAPGLTQGAPNTILGYRYVVNNDMPVMAASAKSILFGDFSNYFIRDVLGVQLLRLQERYADFLQVGFLAFSRHGGVLADAGAGPIRYYQNSAT
ncbi:phage major capsid protein [Lihuaxuella thermophila]|uniref:Phage major capsid protein, HK97 family n=1 Tax=Lihuaxuella thermophila TaxID=1173111 RepID=A0A1H8JID7_9BACL|nr:phage major capsid protein [Lihuaxuella thermophila]SEN79978.1 phage major capsid protein, HK97 family [Lihuaxuella thermophila]